MLMPQDGRRRVGISLSSGEDQLPLRSVVVSPEASASAADFGRRIAEHVRGSEGSVLVLDQIDESSRVDLDHLLEALDVAERELGDSKEDVPAPLRQVVLLGVPGGQLSRVMGSETHAPPSGGHRDETGRSGSSGGLLGLLGTWLPVRKGGAEGSESEDPTPDAGGFLGRYLAAGHLLPILRVDGSWTCLLPPGCGLELVETSQPLAGLPERLQRSLRGLPSEQRTALTAANPLFVRQPEGRVCCLVDLSVELAAGAGRRLLWSELALALRDADLAPERAGPFYRPYHLELLDGHHHQGFFTLRPLLQSGPQVRRLAAAVALDCRELLERSPVLERLRKGRPLVVVGFSDELCALLQLLAAQLEGWLEAWIGSAQVSYRVVRSYAVGDDWPRAFPAAQDEVFLVLAGVQATFQTLQRMVRWAHSEAGGTAAGALALLWVADPGRLQGLSADPTWTLPEAPRLGPIDVPLAVDGHNVPARVGVVVEREWHRPGPGKGSCPMCAKGEAPLVQLDVTTLQPEAGEDLPDSLGHAKQQSREHGEGLPERYWRILADNDGSLVPEPWWSGQPAKRFWLDSRPLVEHAVSQDRRVLDRLVDLLRPSQGEVRYLASDAGPAATLLGESLAQRLPDAVWLTLPTRSATETGLPGERPELRPHGAGLVWVTDWLASADRVRAARQAAESLGVRLVAIAAFAVNPTRELLGACRAQAGAPVRLLSAFRLLLPEQREADMDPSAGPARDLEERLRQARWPAWRTFLRGEQARLQEAAERSGRPSGDPHRRGVDAARLTHLLYDSVRSGGPTAPLLESWCNDPTLFSGERAEEGLRSGLLRRGVVAEVLTEHPFAGLVAVRQATHEFLSGELDRFHDAGDDPPRFSTWLDDPVEVVLGPGEASADLAAALARYLTVLVKVKGRQRCPRLLTVETLRVVAAVLDALHAYEELPEADDVEPTMRLQARLLGALKRCASRFQASLRLEESLDHLMYRSGYFARRQDSPWLVPVYVENTAGIRWVLDWLEERRSHGGDSGELDERSGRGLDRLCDEFFRVREVTEAERSAFRRMLPALGRLERRLGRPARADDPHGGVLDAAIEDLCLATGASAGILALRPPGDEPQVPLVRAADYNWPTPFPDTAWEGMVTYRRLETREPGIVREPKGQTAATLSGRGLGQVLCWPLVWRGEAVGSVSLYRPKPVGKEDAFLMWHLRAAGFHASRLAQTANDQAHSAFFTEWAVQREDELHRQSAVGVLRKTSAMLGTEHFESVGDLVGEVLSAAGWQDLLGKDPLPTLWFFDAFGDVLTARSCRGYELAALCPSHGPVSEHFLGPHVRAAVKLQGHPDDDGEVEIPVTYVPDVDDLPGGFTYRDVDGLKDVRRMLVVPLFHTDRRLMGLLTVFGKSERAPDRIVVDKAEQALQALSISVSIGLEIALYRECTKLLDKLLSSKTPTSYTLEEGYLDDAVGDVAGDLGFGQCYLFHAADRQSFFLAGSFPTTDQAALERHRFKAAEWPGWAAGKRRFKVHYSVDEAVDDGWPTAISELLRNRRDLDRPVLASVWREGDGGKEGAITDVLLAIGKEPLGGSKRVRPQRVTRLFTIEDVRKLALVFPAIHGALERRLDSMHKDRFVSVTTHGFSGKLGHVQSLHDTLKRRLRQERLDDAAATARQLDDGLRSFQNQFSAASFYLRLLEGDHSGLTADAKAVSLKGLIKDVVTLHRREVERRKRTRFHQPLERDHSIWANREAALVALDMVVENATKYVWFDSKSGIRIRSRASGRYAIIEVADWGVGIPEADLERVFELYYRSEVPDRRFKRPGAGIGLYLAREIVRAHGGMIWATCRRASQRRDMEVIENVPHVVQVTIKWPVA